MPFERFRRKLAARRAQEVAPGTEYLHDVERFMRILETERMRADRSGSSFSLAVFTLPEVHDEAEAATFAQHVRARMRATDHAGWMDDGRIGVVLWDTDEPGAWKYVDNVTQSWMSPRRPGCEVYLYPTYLAPPETQVELDGPVKDEKPHNDSIDSNDLAPPTGGVNSDGVNEPLGQEALTNKEHEALAAQFRRAEPLELLFVKPLPWWKRAIDVCGATFGLIVLSPLLLCAAAAIKWTSRGPMFFIQERDGLAGRRFKIYKFRTMYVDAEARKAALRKHSEQDGPAFKMENDPRITPLGGWMRKTCIDELPQLWNVLIGDMTLVGPRPLDCKEAQYIDGWRRRRIEVTPGLTCIWQVHGKSKVTFTEWMRMDIRYMKARTFFRDVRLVLETMVAVVMHRGSH